MSTPSDVFNALQSIALDSRYHGILSLVKAFRNGLVYGTRVRLPHAFVITFVFRSGTLREKIAWILEATREHAVHLGQFALYYKLFRNLLAWIKAKEDQSDSFYAGLLGGYLAFGRNYGAINRQIVMYGFCQVLIGLGRIMTAPPAKGRPATAITVSNPELRTTLYENGWPVFASLISASMMYMYRWHPGSMQATARSSLYYIHSASDRWDSLRTLLIKNE